MLNGELTPRSNLIGELTGGVFYGTNDYEELINKPSINGVELVGNKTTSDLGIDIPTELSELTNDVGFITSADVPTKTSDLTNDSGYITSADVSAVGLSGDYDDLTNKPTIPTLTSQLTNDSGFITNAQVPTMTSQLFNDSGYITKEQTDTEINNGVTVDTYSGLQTTSKTVIGAINEVNAKASQFEVTGTLLTGATSITLSDASIATTSTIDIYTDVFGIQPTNASVTTGSITLTFLAQASDISVKVRVS